MLRETYLFYRVLYKYYKYIVIQFTYRIIIIIYIFLGESMNLNKKQVFT